MPDHKRVLLVEDEPDQRMLFNMALTSAGYQVDAVESGEEARECLVTGKFDLLVTDWYLPGIGGDELIREARQAVDGLHSILMSSHAHVCDAAVHVGADGWFRKSEGVLCLLQVINALN